jgi:pimeloyl-ACP methyl ester carboxylesterase
VQRIANKGTSGSGAGRPAAGASVTRMSPSLPGLRPSTIEVDGRAVALDTGGAGPPVLLLHGFPQTRHAWRLVAPQLTDRFAVV